MIAVKWPDIGVNVSKISSYFPIEVFSETLFTLGFSRFSNKLARPNLTFAFLSLRDRVFCEKKSDYLFELLVVNLKSFIPEVILKRKTKSLFKQI